MKKSFENKIQAGKNILKLPAIQFSFRLLWYLILIFLLFLFFDTPRQGFRYWGL